MDKRWLGILIILIVGCCCMYFVATSSDSVGLSITKVNKTLITLPSDFSIEDTEKGSAKIINWNTNQTIHIKDLGKQDNAFDKFQEKINELKKDPKIKINGNSTRNISGKPTYTIDITNTTSGNPDNSTIAYVFTCNHTFVLKLKNYKDNKNKLNHDLDFVVKNMKIDYKQSQD